MKPASLLLAALALLFALPALAAEPVRRPLLITVDDLPITASRLHTDPAERERITRGLLDALRKHGIRAVGLVTWRRVIDEPHDLDLLRRWLDAGHELGNHSTNHLNYSATEPETYIADVEAARKRLGRTRGRRGAHPDRPAQGAGRLEDRAGRVDVEGKIGGSRE